MLCEYCEYYHDFDEDDDNSKNYFVELDDDFDAYEPACILR